jgi:hypothetical protein
LLPPAQAQVGTAAGPYAFFGIRLGMTVGEFKRLLAPVSPGIHSVAVCEDYFEADYSGHTVRCTWQQDRAEGGTVTSAIALGDIAVVDYSFEFAPASPGSEPRLYQFVLVTPNDARAIVFKRLSERFGPPSQALVDDTNWSAEWRNGVSLVRLQSPIDRSGDVTLFSLTRGAPSARVDD